MWYRSIANAPWFARYGFAIVLVALAFTLTIAVSPFREHGNFLFFFAAVIVCQLSARTGPAILAAVLSVATVEFFLVPPIYEFDVTWDKLVGSAVFVVLVLAIHWLQSRTHRMEQVLAQTEEQFRLARKIQQKLFPTGAPQRTGFDIAGACYPADATGGDYYDFIPMSNGGLGIAIGDVSSHGFGPSLLMAEVHACIRALALTQADVGEILTLTNRLVCQDTEDEQFITVFLGYLDTQERTFVYASAGQQGLLLDSSGTMIKLDSTGLPLGVEATEVIQCAPRIHLDDGCFVLLITDGVFEAKDLAGRSFGIEGALDIIRVNRDQPAPRIVELLCQAVRAFSQNGRQNDDITAVVVKAEPVAVSIGSAIESSPTFQAQGQANGSS